MLLWLSTFQQETSIVKQRIKEQAPSNKDVPGLAVCAERLNPAPPLRAGRLAVLDHLPKATKKQYMQAYKSAYKQINKHPGPAHSARHLKSSKSVFAFGSLLLPFCLHMPPICLSYASHMPPICLPWPPSASKLSPSVPQDAPRWPTWGPRCLQVAAQIA